MSCKKKKDAMTKEQLQQEIEWQKVEIKRLERQRDLYLREQQEAVSMLNQVPGWVLRIFVKKK